MQLQKCKVISTICKCCRKQRETIDNLTLIFTYLFFQSFNNLRNYLFFVVFVNKQPRMKFQLFVREKDFNQYRRYNTNCEWRRLLLLLLLYWDSVVLFGVPSKSWNMIEGVSPLSQAAMGTLFTWALTAAGSALVFIFRGGQVWHNLLMLNPHIIGITNNQVICKSA